MQQDTPWYHWLIAVFALVWHGAAAAEYVMSRYEMPAYEQLLTPDQWTFVQSLPMWIDIAWAVFVWAGLLGAILLFIRGTSEALWLAFAFAGALAVTIGALYVIVPSAADLIGWDAYWMLWAVTGVEFLLFLYARQMHVRARQASSS